MLDSVRRLMVGRTVVIVAHRPSLLALADRVVQLAPGRGGVLMPGDGSEHGGTQMAPLGRTLAIARPAAGRLALTALLGAGAIAADIGLLATAAWLISKAAQHPNESQLAVAIVGVQFFGLSRGFFRYKERLVGHDAAFRLLADLRVRVYVRLERLAPSGLPAFRRGDLLARMVQDIDSLQDLVIRVIPPFGTAVMVGALTVALLWWMLPAAAVILAVALLLAGILVPWLTGLLGRRRESRFAQARGDLGVSVVDLTEGAAELVAFGAMDAHLAVIGEQDAGAHRHRCRIGGYCWGRLVAHHPAGRARLLGLSRGRYPGGDHRQAERHRSGGGDSHPAGRLRAGGRVTRCHPGPPAGAAGGCPDVRGHRRAGSGGRSRGFGAAAPTAPMTWTPGQCGPDTRMPALRRSGGWTSRSAPAGGWRWWDRAVPASRHWPRCSSDSCPSPPVRSS